MGWEPGLLQRGCQGRANTRGSLIRSFLAQRDPINSPGSRRWPRGGVFSIRQHDYSCSRNSAPMAPPRLGGIFPRARRIGLNQHHFLFF